MTSVEAPYIENCTVTCLTMILQRLIWIVTFVICRDFNRQGVLETAEHEIMALIKEVDPLIECE